MPESNILQTAIAAHTAGLCPIRAVTDGRKAPFGEWKRWMGERPGLDDIQTWFKNWPNVGIVCGAISDRLVCIEFEGRFHRPSAVNALKAAGLFEMFSSWMTGYMEETPSGGVHILVHYGGDGPVPGNTKIALDAQRETLIETRGEGGFVIVAPSNGTTHSSGKAWKLFSGGFDSIAWVQPEEYDAVIACLGQFDECPTQPAPPPPARPRLTLVQGESWLAEELALLPPIEQCLEDEGWRYLRDEPLGSLWKRPGKTTPGHSARVNLNGRLIVFSSAAYLPAGRTTYDTLDVVLGAALGRPPTLDERTAELRALRQERLGGKWTWKHLEPQPPEPSVSSDLWLPASFWSQRPVLQAIHDEALRSSLSPEGVLGAFLSCYATTVPMSIKLPAIIGAPSPLNTYAALVARSGGGKSTSMALALDLLGYGGRNRHVLLGRSLRSGEGLISLAIHAKGDAETGPIYNNAVQVVFDEGGTLSAQASRTGSTTISYLNTAWAGHGVVGGAKASESGSFPADLVRVCCVMGVQFGVCANLFTGEAAFLGFPQRLLYFGLNNPVLRTIEPTVGDVEDAKPLDVQFWDHGEFIHNTRRIGVPADIELEVKRWTLQRNAGDLPEDLNSHQMLLCLRTAALFALIEGRGDVNEQDWWIADSVCTTSRTIRSHLVQSIGEVTVNREKQRGRLDAVRADAADWAWLDQRSDRIARHLRMDETGFSLKEVKSKLNPSERPRRDEILAHGIARGLIVHRDGRYFAR